MKRTVGLISFSDIEKCSEWFPSFGRMYFSNTVKEYIDFESEGQDEDGEFVVDIENLECITVYYTFTDYVNENNPTHIPIEYSGYSVMSIKVNCNELRIISIDKEGVRI